MSGTRTWRCASLEFEGRAARGAAAYSSSLFDRHPAHALDQLEQPGGPAVVGELHFALDLRDEPVLDEEPQRDAVADELDLVAVPALRLHGEARLPQPHPKRVRRYPRRGLVEDVCDALRHTDQFLSQRLDNDEHG